MALSDWKKTLISDKKSMFDSMRLIDETAMQIALVVNENNKLLGVVTDGDIRRAILAGKDVNVSVSEIMSKNPTCGSLEESRDMLVNRMRKLELHHMPIVDENGKIVDLVMTEYTLIIN